MNKFTVFYLTEMWEKFMFFGMRAILPLFLVHSLGFSQKDSALYYGAYLALSYFTPLIGGMIADRFIGQKRAIIIGGVLFCLAQLTLFFASFYSPDPKTTTIIALGLIVLGNGMFKPNIVANLTSTINERSKMDAVFSMYYLFINIGALLGQIIVPLLGDRIVDGVRDNSAFGYGFLAAFFAMLIGVIIYSVFSKNLPDNIGSKRDKAGVLDISNVIKATLVFVVVFAFFVYFAKNDNFIEQFLYPMVYSVGIAYATFIAMDKTLTKEELGGIFIIFVCAIFITFFWAAAEQAGTSLTFIADSQTDRVVFGYDVPPSMVQMANPLFLIIIAPIFSIFWAKLAVKGKEPSSLNKQAIGMAFMALSFLIIAFNVKDLGSNLLALKWLLLLYFIQVIAEMLISPIGLSLVGKEAPRRSAGQLYGLFYMANAAGYALSGTLAALIPPTADKFIKAKELGVDLQSVLDGTQLSTQILTKLQEANLPTSYPSIFGFEIVSLYNFFILFFIICATACVLIFAINFLFGDKR